MDAFTDFALRLIGAFYALVSFLGICRVALNLMLTNALVGIRGPGTPEEQREASAERLRAGIMLVLLVLGGAAGLALALMLDVAVPLMLAVNALSILHVAVIAPRWLDPYDPPEPEGRRTTLVATAVYCAATLWAMAYWHSGRMVAVRDAHPGYLAALGLGVLLFVGEAIRRWRSASDLPASPLRTGGRDDPDAIAEWEQACVALEGVPLLLWPAACDSSIRDARDGQPLKGWPLPVPELKDYDTLDLYQWERDFHDALDPADPTRTRFRSAGAREAVMVRGREILAGLQARIGDRIRLPDSDLAQTIAVFPTRVRVRAVGEEYPLIDPDREWPNQNVWSAAFGLSTGLENDLGEWGDRFDESLIDPDDPLLADRETLAATFNREGRALAARLVGELAATGRSHIEVSFETRSGAVEVIHAPDEPTAGPADGQPAAV